SGHAHLDLPRSGPGIRDVANLQLVHVAIGDQHHGFHSGVLSPASGRVDRDSFAGAPSDTPLRTWSTMDLLSLRNANDGKKLSHFDLSRRSPPRRGRLFPVVPPDLPHDGVDLGVQHEAYGIEL